MSIVTGILEGIASLGVPWWGWAALVVMIFFGLLVPKAEDEATVLAGPVLAAGGRT